MSDQEQSNVQNRCDYGNGPLAEIHLKLDRLDVAIRGNGKPGILIRLDRLEQDAKRQARVVWLIVGACSTAVASGLVAWIAS